MLKTIAPLLLVVTLLGATAVHVDQLPDDLGNVWRADRIDGGSCSCFPVLCEKQEDGTFRILWMTARHCTDDYLPGLPFFLASKDGQLLDALVFAEHPELDLAILESFSSKPIRTRALDLTPTDLGEEVTAAGFPMGLDLWITEGRLSGPGDEGTENLSADLAPGMSGGPVANERGAIVGVNARCYGMPEGAHFMAAMVPLHLAKEWIDATVR